MPKQLNPKLWDGWELKPEVLNGIKKICDFFLNNHMDKSIKINPVDIHIVGSNAGFNYTDKSDVDIHIVDGNTNVDDLTQYAQWKAVRDFNKQYDITLKGVPVELYIENINSPAVSRGVFSVNQNKWLTRPRSECLSRNATLPTLNDKDSWVQLITQTIKNGSVKAIDTLLTKLYAMRKGSIASSGETGEGNLLFKSLRDAGYVDRLKDAKDKAVSKELSVESLNEGLLTERTRSELIRQSKDSYKGTQRYKRRTKSRVANTVAQYNRIDMNKLFKEDILTVDISVIGETDNYTVKISFGGFLEILRDEIEKGGKFDLRAVIRALITGFDKEDTFVWCSCLHPSTKIKLLDGTTPTVEEMKKRFDAGEKLYVFSVDDNGDFQPGAVRNVWITKTTSKFIRVTLDNNETILTTPEHRYMLRNGEWEEARNLVVGQSLMPMYFKETSNGYDTVKFNSSSRYRSVYKMVAEYFYSKQISETDSKAESAKKMTYNVAIHHKDFNKHNNNPENLQVMSSYDHWMYHASLMKERWKDEGWRNMQSQKATEWIKKLNANPTENMKKSRAEWLQKGIAHNYDPSWKPIQAEIMRKAIKKYHDDMSDEEREHLSARLSEKSKRAWENGSFDTEKFKTAARNNGKNLHTAEIEMVTAEGVRKYWSGLSSEQKADRMKRGFITKIKNTLIDMMSKGIELTEENYISFSKSNRKYIRFQRFFDSFDEMIVDMGLRENFNHKVVKVEEILLPETPVYDISVESAHNFVVDAGVVLHNCADWYYRFSYQSTQHDYNSGEPQSIPARITNPNNSLGSACKHVLLVLSNHAWILKVASVIRNYVQYMEKNYQKMYADIIYPAIYGKKYEAPVQMQIDDTDELQSDTATLDKSNIQAKKSTQFQQGNKLGWKFAPKQKDDKQTELDVQNKG